MAEKQNPKWLPPPSKISNQGYYWPSVTFLFSVRTCRPSWCKSVKNWPIYNRLCIFKMTVTAILYFTESWILGHNNPCMANVYRPTKFDANVFIDDRDTVKK